MKLKRIDNEQLFNYATNFKTKHSHRHAVSEFVEFKQIPTANNFLKTARQSIDFKTQKERLTSRNNQRKYQTVVINQHHHQSQKKITFSQEQQKILSIFQKTQLIYNKLALVYKMNEQKLAAILTKHIKQQYYIFSKQLFLVIRCVRLHLMLHQKILSHTYPHKILHEMTKFHQFLEKFYSQQCLRHIQITEDNIIQRERAIREQTSKERYKLITKSFCPRLITNQVDIVEEFRQINCGKNKQLNPVQCQLFRKLRSLQGKVSNLFNEVCLEKENRLFQGRF